MNSDRVTNTDQRAEHVDVFRTNAESNEGAACEPPLLKRDATWLCGLLQAGDSFYPTGSYAHSFGLEGLVLEGAVQDRETLREFLFRSLLPSLRQSELPLAAHAWRALAAEDWKRVGELCVLSSAMKSAREARLAAENIGRQRAELVATLRNDPVAKAFLRRATEERWPFSPAISAVLEGRAVGAPLVAIMTGLMYANIAGVLSAAVKLLRLGQNACQTLLTETLQEAPGIIVAAEQVPYDEIGWFNPWLDIASARHESADARMFIS